MANFTTFGQEFMNHSNYHRRRHPHRFQQMPGTTTSINANISTGERQRQSCTDRKTDQPGELFLLSPKLQQPSD